MTTNSNDWPSELRSALDAYFSEEDLEALCFDLRIDYQALPGESKPKKVVELISLMSRKGRVVELIDRCRHYRPNVPWDELRNAASDDPLVFNSISRMLRTSSREKPRPKVARQRLPLWVPIVAALVVVVICAAIAIFLFLQAEEQPVIAVEPTSMPLVESEATITPTLTDLPPTATVTPPPAGDSIATITSTPSSMPPTATMTPPPAGGSVATITSTPSSVPPTATVTPNPPEAESPIEGQSGWGLEGDLPIVGDFDRDGNVDDVAVFRPSNQRWYYDYDHNGTSDEQFEWGLTDDLPIAGDFDRDGNVDDVAVFRPSNQRWYYDYDHNGGTDEQFEWGLEGDLPMAGDFGRDGNVDDVAVFRPSNQRWYYDYDHNGGTDEQVFNLRNGFDIS